MNRFRLTCRLLLGVASVSLFGVMIHAGPDSDSERILFQASTDKRDYHPGETAIIRLTVTNRGTEPFFISHEGLGICGKGTGFVELQLLDRDNKNVRKTGCDVAEFRPPGITLKDTFRSPRSWVLLMGGEIYGSEEPIELPQRKGVYHLAAELRPPGFSREQLDSLASENIRVLRSPHVAESVMIVIK